MPLGNNDAGGVPLHYTEAQSRERGARLFWEALPLLKGRPQSRLWMREMLKRVWVPMLQKHGLAESRHILRINGASNHILGVSTVALVLILAHDHQGLSRKSNDPDVSNLHDFLQGLLAHHSFIASLKLCEGTQVPLPISALVCDVKACVQSESWSKVPVQARKAFAPISKRGEKLHSFLESLARKEKLRWILVGCAEAVSRVLEEDVLLKRLRTVPGSGPKAQRLTMGARLTAAARYASASSNLAKARAKRHAAEGTHLEHRRKRPRTTSLGGDSTLVAHQNALYLEAVQQQFGNTAALALNSDGTRLGGRKILMTSMMNLESRCACWAPPQVCSTATVVDRLAPAETF